MQKKKEESVPLYSCKGCSGSCSPERTWGVIGHAWDQLQMCRTDTRGRAEAQLQQEVMAVLMLPCLYTGSRIT